MTEKERIKCLKYSHHYERGGENCPFCQIEQQNKLEQHCGLIDCPCPPKNGPCPNCEADAFKELNKWRAWFWDWQDKIPDDIQKKSPASWLKTNAAKVMEGE